jgi:hypothetical protein
MSKYFVPCERQGSGRQRIHTAKKTKGPRAIRDVLVNKTFWERVAFLRKFADLHVQKLARKKAGTP